MQTTVRAVPNASFAVGGTNPVSCVAVALVASLLSVPPLVTAVVAVNTGGTQSTTVMVAVLVVVKPCPSVAVQLRLLVPTGRGDPEGGEQVTVAPNSSVALGGV